MMFSSLVTAALALAGVAIAADAPAGGPVFMNSTEAGSRITYPTEETTSACLGSTSRHLVFIGCAGSLPILWDGLEDSWRGR